MGKIDFRGFISISAPPTLRCRSARARPVRWMAELIRSVAPAFARFFHVKTRRRGLTKAGKGLREWRVR